MSEPSGQAEPSHASHVATKHVDVAEETGDAVDGPQDGDEGAGVKTEEPVQHVAKSQGEKAGSEVVEAEAEVEPAVMEAEAPIRMADDSKDGGVDGKAHPEIQNTNRYEVESHNAGAGREADAETAAETAAEALRRQGQDQRDIEQEAIEHMARRAAGLNLDTELASKNKTDLPASPPPPPPPRKDNPPSKPPAVENEYDEKHPPADEAPAEVPEAPQGTSEATGAEIQTIMDQFASGTEAPGEEEIMSPRRDRQQSVLVLPPRSSSLEPKRSFTHSPQTTGQSTQSPLSPQQSHAPFIAPEAGLEHVKSDDTASIASSKAGSIFQPPPPNLEPEPALPFDFHRFLEQLRHRTADPVARFLRSFLNEFGKKQWMVHEQVKIISDFLEFISKKMAQCDVWRAVSDAEFDNAREGMEKLVMNRLSSQTFSPAIPLASSPRKNARGRQADVANPYGAGRRGQHQEDVERDDVIAQKLRIYGWIREEHLDIKSIGDKGQKFLTLAQQELLKINTYRAPRDKVICVLNCCKVIFGFLKNAKADQSADAFVPLLIYTVLRARPEHLVSNVQYIWRFRNQDKLGGEAGYYMSSLTGVVTFIENLDRTNLTISDEEFEKNVEAAVSAIAEKNKSEEYEDKVHSPSAAASAAAAAGPGPVQHLSEKSALSRAEVTPRNSMEAESSSPRRNTSQRMSEKSSTFANMNGAGADDEPDAVTGLLRSIQKPLSSIGRMFSDDATSSSSSPQLQPGGTTSRSRSPAPLPGRLNQRPSGDGEHAQRLSSEKAQRQEAEVRQASAEVAEVQKARRREWRVVCETLQSMFPNLEKDLITDVVRAQEGNVGRAVDACLALSG